MANNLFQNVPVDLCSCYEPCFEPPAEQLAEWNGEPEPTLENTSFYVTDVDGTQYFYCGKLCIKISEHFTDNGKQMDELVEDAVCHQAGQTDSVAELLKAV